MVPSLSSMSDREMMRAGADAPIAFERFCGAAVGASVLLTIRGDVVLGFGIGASVWNGVAAILIGEGVNSLFGTSRDGCSFASRACSGRVETVGLTGATWAFHTMMKGIGVGCGSMTLGGASGWISVCVPRSLGARSCGGGGAAPLVEAECGVSTCEAASVGLGVTADRSSDSA